MPLKKIAAFDVQYLQILDEQGNCDEKLKPKLSVQEIKELYEWMALIRAFDEKILNLQRQGRVGTHAPLRGQEASQVGTAYVLDKKDWLFPSYREVGALVVRGAPMKEILRYIAGDEWGQHCSEEVNNFPTAIPVGTQPLHAVGAAMAATIKKEKTAALVYFGDGATSTGDVHEAMNFAGVFQAPTVFICQNNQYAISVPRCRQTNAQTLAQKAIAYGFEGMQVDGNDIFAVYKATKDAITKAKAGKGPTFIECLTYRQADHTTADDASKYRTEKELQMWIKKDPIDRMRKYMMKKKLWTDTDETAMRTRMNEKIEAAVHEFEKIPRPSPEEMFKYTYDTMTPALLEQWHELQEFIQGTANQSGQQSSQQREH